MLSFFSTLGTSDVVAVARKLSEHFRTPDGRSLFGYFSYPLEIGGGPAANSRFITGQFNVLDTGPTSISDYSVGVDCMNATHLFHVLAGYKVGYAPIHEIDQAIINGNLRVGDEVGNGTYVMIARDEVRPGDVVIFDGHMALVTAYDPSTGKGRMIHSSAPSGLAEVAFGPGSGWRNNPPIGYMRVKPEAYVGLDQLLNTPKQGNFLNYSAYLESLSAKLSEAIYIRAGRTDKLGWMLAGDDYIVGKAVPKNPDSADDLLYGGDGNDRLVGLGGNDALVGGTGADTLEGGAGNDSLDGGDGDDTAVFSGRRAEYTLSQTSAGNITVTDLTPGRDGTDHLTNIRFIRFADQVLDLAPRGTPGRDTLIGSEFGDTIDGLAGHDRLYGRAGNDQIWGGSGKDRLYGETGNDRLYGGAHNDVLTGGKGKDVFVFDTKLGSAKTDRKVNFDKITDFNVKDDSIWLENKIFKKLGKKGSELKPAKLNKKFFTIGDKAKDKNDYLIYDKKKGILLYDPDGSGSKEAVEFAQLSKNLKLTHKDFFVI